MLWLLIFGETFNRIHAIPTGPALPRLPSLGIIAQSQACFVAIFSIRVIWEHDT